jgi:hypothetical protein
VLELFDDVLLVAALVGEVDRLLGRGRGREVRHHVAVAPELKEFSLVVLLDALAADHQPIGLPTALWAVGDLGDPLPLELEIVLTSLTRQAASQIRSPLAAA